MSDIAQKSKRSKKRRRLFVFILLFGAYVLMELTAFTYFCIKKERMFSFSGMSTYRNKVAQNPNYFSYKNRIDKVQHKVDPQSIHPYLGFVRDAKKLKDTSAHGFLGKDTPFAKKTKDNVIVGLFGGSFAMGLSRREETLKKAFSEVLAFKNKDIIIQPLALGGFKQPQQLMTLSYFLSLGAHFDILINVDGFNEVALPYTDNRDKGVYPLFPRLWFARFQTSLSPDLLKIMMGAQLQVDKRQNLAKTFSSFPLNYSVACNVLYQILDEKAYGKWNDFHNAYNHYNVDEKKGMDYAVSGPEFDFNNLDLLFETATENWCLASLQMHRLCQANNINYYHFIQPNQYVRGSKIFGEKERKIAFYPDDRPYPISVRRGYPIMLKKSERLKKQGVVFTDLTMIFKDVEEIMYADTCCHLNAAGYDRVIEKIAEIIKKR